MTNPSAKNTGTTKCPRCKEITLAPEPCTMQQFIVEWYCSECGYMECRENKKYPHRGADPHYEDVEAICLDCGQKFAGGCVEYRTLDAYDDNPEPYCPICDGDSLEFHKPRDKDDG